MKKVAVLLVAYVCHSLVYGQLQPVSAQQASQPVGVNSSLLDRNYYDLIKEWTAEYGDLYATVPESDHSTLKKIQRFMKVWGPLAMEHKGDLRKAYNAYTNKDNGGIAIANRGASGTSLSNSTNWRELGPFNSPSNYSYIGRINFMYFHPSNSKEIFACSSVSGMFYSKNSGGEWKEVTDNLPTFNLAVSSVAISPNRPDRWFVATGTGDESLHGHFAETEGIFYTDDKGDSWNKFNPSSSVFNMNNAQIHKIVFHPANQNILFAATNKGIYKADITNLTSTSWQKVANVDVFDIEFHPTDANVIYAGGTRLWYSKDAGDTWQSLPNSSSLPLDPGPYVQVTNSRCDDIGWEIQRFSLEVDRNEPDRLWITHSGQRKFRGILYLAKLYEYNHSNNTILDRGAIPHGGRNYGTTFHDHVNEPDCIINDGESNDGSGMHQSRARAFVVDQKNSDYVYVGNVNPIYRYDRSTDSWSTLTSISDMHDDLHHFEYDNTGRFWVAHDGGVSVSKDNGATWHHKVMNLPIAMVYHLDANKDNPYRLVYGCQDDGSNFYDNELNGNKWRRVSGGDGFECKYSQADDDIFLTTVNNSQGVISTNGGSSMSNIKTSLTSRRITPHYSNPNILFTGGTNVFKSTNQGSQWIPISDGSDFGSPTKYDVWTTYVSPANSNYLYAHVYKDFGLSTEEHTLYYTTNWGATNPSWTKINIPHKGWFGLAMHNSNPNKFWINYGAKNANNIFEYNGSSFIDISSSSLDYLSDIEYEYNTNRLFASGRVRQLGQVVRGIAMKEGNNAWEIIDTDALPKSSFTDIDIVQNEGILRIGLFGRGIWETSTPCYFDESSNYEPADGAVINVSTDINQNMIIKAGRHVKIKNCVLRMSQHSCIIVEPGAVLEIEGANITNRCAGSQWRGIQVMGNSSKDMPTNINVSSPSYSSFQGMLILKNSTIQHAHEAFQNHRQYDWGADLNTTGGMIFASGSTFLNCWRSAEFLRYTKDDYKSSFRECEFRCQNNYRGLRSDEDGMNTTISTFVSMWAVDGVSFLGNVFDNQHTAVLPENKGTGIVAIDASYFVDSYRKSTGPVVYGAPKPIKTQAEFKNLTYGVKNHAQTSIGSRIKVIACNFTNVEKGVYDVGSAYSEFNSNNFNIPESSKLLTGTLPFNTNATGYNWGIFTVASTAFEMNDNVFNSTMVNGKTATFGTVIRESGSQGGEVLRNDFNDISMPSQMEDNNLSLKLSCNEYSGYEQAWTVATRKSDVFPPPPPTQKLADQGNGCGNNSKQADNTFDVCGSELQIKSITPFNYYDKKFTNSNLSPSSCSSTILSSSIIDCGINQQFNCSITTGGGSMGTGSQGVASYISQINNTSNLLEKQLLENKLITTYMDLNNKNGAINYLSAKNDLPSKKMLVPTYLKNKDFGACSSTLNSISGTDNETIAFKQYYGVLVNACNNGRELHELNTNEIQQIETISNSKTKVAYNAENLLRMVRNDNINHHPYELIDDANQPAARSANVSSSNYNKSGKNVDEEGKLISVFPNPTQSKTTSSAYYYLGDDNEGFITINDIYGRTIKKISLINGRNQVDLNISDFEKGIFYINMIVNEKLIETKKLILQ